MKPSEVYAFLSVRRLRFINALAIVLLCQNLQWIQVPNYNSSLSYRLIAATNHILVSLRYLSAPHKPALSHLFSVNR